MYGNVCIYKYTHIIYIYIHVIYIFKYLYIYIYVSIQYIYNIIKPNPNYSEIIFWYLNLNYPELIFGDLSGPERAFQGPIRGPKSFFGARRGTAREHEKTRYRDI
jgi:hypothetical protein